MTEQRKPKTYKQLVAEMAAMISEEDFNQVCADIDQAFQAEKISWKDHEILYQLAGMASTTLI